MSGIVVWHPFATIGITLGVVLVLIRRYLNGGVYVIQKNDWMIRP